MECRFTYFHTTLTSPLTISFIVFLLPQTLKLANLKNSHKYPNSPTPTHTHGSFLRSFSHPKQKTEFPNSSLHRKSLFRQRIQIQNTTTATEFLFVCDPTWLTLDPTPSCCTHPWRGRLMAESLWMLSLLILVGQFYECKSIVSSKAGRIASIEKLWKFRDSVGGRGCLRFFPFDYQLSAVSSLHFLSPSLSVSLAFP